MQYESYRGKVKRVAAFLGKVYARRLLILISLAVLTLVVSAMVAAKGFIVVETKCPAEQVYGDKQGYRAYAFLGRVTYEYCEQGSDRWSTERPVFPGEYRVRAMCMSAFGEPRYGGTYDYTIVPRVITPTVSDKRITYGEEPKISVNLAKGDTWTYRLRYESFESIVTRVWVDADSISVTNETGEDRMACYIIADTPRTELRFNLRPLQITVQDSSKVYDDRRLSFDGYEVKEGTLAAGDELMAVFSASITDVGSVENRPQLRIFRSNGIEVTHLYDMKVDAGTLTVEQRPLIIRTGSVTYKYTGYELDYPNYTLDPSTTTAAGHYLEVRSSTSLLDCGSADNVLSFMVRNSVNGMNETSNYAIFVEPGTLKISPRKVTVRTADGALVYNGEEQHLEEFTVENGVGDTVRVTRSAGLCDVGSGRNELTVGFYRGEKDISANYEISYEYGTLTIAPRPLEVATNSMLKEYDGTSLKANGSVVIAQRPYGLVKGHTISVKTKGSVLFGTVAHRYVEGSAQIRDTAGSDVTRNYEISISEGTLTVVPRAVTIATADAEKVYDGDPLRKGSYSIKYGSMLPGHEPEIYTTGSQTDAGESFNTVREDLTKVTDANNGGADVTKYYSFTYEEGRLTVTPRPITVKTGTQAGMYNGNAQTCTNLSVIEGTLVKDHRLLPISGTVPSLTDVGGIENKMEVAILSGDRSVRHNYKITYEYGRLSVTPRTITVRTADGNHVYDAKPFAASECVVDEASPYLLVKRHILVVKEESLRTDTDVGVYANVQTVDVYDETNGLYVTDNYIINYVFGTTVISRRPLTVQLVGEKMYDGTPFEAWKSNYLDGTSICPGHILTLDPVETITDVGEIYPEADADTLGITENGRDVLFNYDVTLQIGHFAVTRRVIDIQSADAFKIYDGLPLTAPYGVVSAGSVPLAPGHALLMTVTGSGTEPGRHGNTMDPASAIILDGDGNDVSYNYLINSVKEGVLTVKYPVTVTVTTGSASKLYDGLPLTCDEYEVLITEGVLPEGYTVSVTVTGKNAGVGTVENTASVTVSNGRGESAEDLVTLVMTPGALTVYADSPTQPDATASFGRVFSDLTGVVYLRIASYGDFVGNRWLAAPAYSLTLPDGYGYQYLTSVALSKLQYKRFALQFADMKTFMLPYYTTIGGPAPAVGSDTVQSEQEASEYIATYFYTGNVSDMLAAYRKLSEAEKEELLDPYAARERSYRYYVRDRYLTVDSRTKQYLKKLIRSEGLDPTDPDIITKVAVYIQNAASYNLDYDPALDDEDNMVMAFLEEYREGVCRHYATAATLLYRTLGIPARYTTGFMAEVRAGEWTEIKTPAHAWVEVYVDGLGWVQVEVTGSASSGEKPPVTEREDLEVIPAFGWKKYDGKVLHAPAELVLTPALEALLEQGYTYEAVTAGEQLEIGVSESRIVSFTLYDPDGRDVTAEFNLIKQTGLLKVTGAAVEVFLYPVEKIYDGKQAIWGKLDYEILSIPHGVTMELEMHIRRTDVGYVTLSDLHANLSDYVSYRLLKGDTDVTADYDLIFCMPKGMEEVPVLTVAPRDIELTAASETRVDSGKPLTNATVYLSKGILIEGHTLSAKACGEQVGVGSSKNTVDRESMDILDAEGRSVLHNYRVTTRDGYLVLAEDR